MSQYIKKSTQLVGIAVAKTPRSSLINLYDQTLSVLGMMPQSSIYRQQTEDITKQRLDIVNSQEDVSKIEKNINCGQIEEVIIQAQAELSLAENIIEWKPWEAPEYSAPLGQWS